jgi:heme/copper-type cytochrome/quinol oxidase subunit 2
LDADNGADLRLALLVVGVLAGPLQPISTELGVEVVYPLSENTVLVIQQLFSNLLSALFIPLFKALKDVGTAKEEANTKFEAPMYTFSFYMLIIIHALSTLYFSTFNGKYLRHEAELAKKAKMEKEENEYLSGYGSVVPY